MKTGLLAIAAILIIVIGTVIGVLALLPPKPGVTKSNFDRLTIGMNQDDAVSILGGYWHDKRIMTDEIVGFRIDLEWNSDDGRVRLHFDDDRRIAKMLWIDRKFPLWQRLQRRLPWLPD